MCCQNQPSVHMGVKGRDNVGKGFMSKDSVLFKEVLSDVPARAVQLTQSRQDVLMRERNPIISGKVQIPSTRNGTYNSEWRFPIHYYGFLVASTRDLEISCPYRELQVG